MKVLYLHQYFVTPDMPGASRSFEIARRLVAAGHEVHVFTLDQSGTRGRQGEWTRSNESGVTVHWLVRKYSNALSYRERVAVFVRYAAEAAVRASIEGGDIVYATSTPLTIAVPAIVASCGRRVPMVFEVRDLWPEVPIAVGALRSWPAITAARVLEGAAYAAAKHIIALSPGMKDGICRTGCDPSRVTVIPNGCDLAMFRVDASKGEDFLERNPMLRGGPLLVYAGTLGRINGVGALVEIAAAMRARAPDVRFLIVGDGAERELVLGLAKNLGVLGKNLFWMPPLAKSEVPALLAACSMASSLVVDIPVLWNNSANKFFDALAASRPVFINYRGWQADIVERSGCGVVVPPRDAQVAANMLVEFLRDPERNARAREAAARLAENDFSRDRLAGEVIKILERVAS
jgi:glycosyltransferase involved in cell wall biosynthesis